jgi:hypothetical protein
MLEMVRRRNFKMPLLLRVVWIPLLARREMGGDGAVL